MSHAPLIVERTYNAPVSKVWRALTDKAQMKEWYFNVDDFRPEVGFEFSFAGCGSAGEEYVHRCVVTEVVQEKKLAYSWSYEGLPGTSVVTFELFPEGGGTRVKLTHAGLETFPQARPDFRRESFTEGWTEILGKSLKDFLEAGNAADYQTNFSTTASRQQILRALTAEIANWWTADFTGSAKAAGDSFTVRFGKTFKTFVVKEASESGVSWTCTDAFISMPKLARKDEWKGTTIRWTMAADGERTRLTMTHEGLSPAVECYEVCEQGWNAFAGSLKDWVEAGKGKPYSPPEKTVH